MLHAQVLASFMRDFLTTQVTRSGMHKIMLGVVHLNVVQIVLCTVLVVHATRTNETPLEIRPMRDCAHERMK
jgi:uncharacterized membrane protein (DUF485 family)